MSDDKQGRLVAKESNQRDEILTLNVQLEEQKTMSAEYFNLLMAESAGNMSANNRDGRNVGTAAIGALTAGIAKTHNELGPVESRAVSGVMATPVASPTLTTG